MQGREFGSEPGCVTIGEPLIFGTLFREAALGLAGLTAPGMADCVEAGLFTVPGILLLVPTVPGSCPLLVLLLGDGLDGATPGDAEPGVIDGAVARPVAPVDGATDGAVPVPLAPPLAAPDEPDDPVPCAWAESPMTAANPAAKMIRDVCDIAFAPSKDIPQREANVRAFGEFRRSSTGRSAMC